MYVYIYVHTFRHKYIYTYICIYMSIYQYASKPQTLNPRRSSFSGAQTRANAPPHSAQASLATIFCRVKGRGVRSLAPK